MKKTLILSLLVLLGCLVAGLPLVAQDEAAETGKDAEGIEILKKVDAAIKKVSSVRYTAEAAPGGVAVNFTSPGKGSAVLSGWTGQVPEKFLIEAETKMPGSDETIKITAGGDGGMYFLIDHASKKVYQDMDPAVLGSSASLLFGFAVIEFVHNAPFDDELNAEKVELQGTEKMGDEDCYKVHVVYAGGQGQSTWYFSKSDYLPRGRIQHFSTPQGDGSIERKIFDLKVDPKVDASLFAMKIPEGYEQIDDFAP
jgi:outer membrane lipoprotein-sorting protein